MENLRGEYGDPAYGHGSNGDLAEDDATDDVLPPQIGADERRMQVRAYNFWASLLADRNLPHVSDLDPEALPDFGPNGVLLDFSNGIEDPAISFLGERLAEECDADRLAIRYLSDVPARSLLSRITDHYMQILTNQAPIGFEAEFVNQRGATILYRGILLPFSSDDETIDYIFGVINWKEMAGAREAEELLLEIDQALEEGRSHRNAAPMADWADGPGADSLAVDAPVADHLPRPSFGLDDLSGQPVDAAGDVAMDEDEQFMGLGDYLASARELAQRARSSEDRTRSALYDAIGRAHDFALAAAEAPAEFAGIVEDAGLAVQDRAPLTPVVKLVFGADYDKTRLTEYAAALSHAQRIGLGRGMLADYLRQADGGLKGVVKEERRLRRAESGKPAVESAAGPRKSLVRKLRAMAPRPIAAIDRQGEEFALVMVRRTDEGEVVLLGEVPADTALVERAARRLLD